jgi:ferrous iron transport protein B
MNETLPVINETENAKPVVLVGNPNVGKSVIFGYLTGKYVNVSNYPGTTVEVSRGKINLDSISVPVIDTPGTNSFISQSEDEEVTRDVLLEGDYGTVVQVSDSKNLRRSLPVTIQLAEMGTPFILVQNMADEAKSRGAFIDYPLLEKIFGIPVISTTATQRKGLPHLKKTLRKPGKSHFKFKYPAVIENGISRIIEILPESPISKRSIALMLLAGDQSLSKWIRKNLSDVQISLMKPDDRYSSQAGL